MHDAFISYSRRDSAFADSLERRLEKYKPPKELDLPSRFLDVFRDTKDFTGPDYPTSLAKHLHDSSALIVLCSPDARASDYVNQEIRNFAEAKGKDRIVPVLVGGIPNNEAKPGQEKDKAFPEALYEYFEMPLAINYLGFEPRHDKVDKGAYFDAWFTLLANLFGLSRSEVEQRERKRRARRLQIAIASTASVISLLVVALIITLISRSEAISQAIAARNQTSTRLAVQALEKIDETPEEALHLAIQAVETYHKYGDPPVSRAIEALHKARLSFGGGRPAIPWREDQASLIHSPDLLWVATSGDDGIIRFSKAGSGVVEILEPPANVLNDDERWADTRSTEILFTARHLIAVRMTIKGDKRHPRDSIMWFWRVNESGISSSPELLRRIEDDSWSGLQLRASPDSRWLTWREGKYDLYLHAVGSTREPFAFKSLDSRRPLTAFSNDSREFVVAVRDGLQKVLLERPEMPPAPRPPVATTTESKPGVIGEIKVTGTRLGTDDVLSDDPNVFETVMAEVLTLSASSRISLNRSLALATATRFGRRREDGSYPAGFSRIAVLSRNGKVELWDLDTESTEAINIGSIYSAYAEDMEVYGLDESEQDVTFEFDPSGQNILAAVAHHSGEFGIISRIELAGADGWTPLVMEQLRDQTTARVTRSQGSGLGISSGYKLINQKRLGGRSVWPILDIGALTLGMDGTLLFRDLDSDNSALIATGVSDVSFTNYGNWLPVGMVNGKVRLVDMDDEEGHIEISAHDSAVKMLSQNGLQTRIITSDGEGVARVWDLKNPVFNAEEGDVEPIGWRWAIMDDTPEGVAWDLTSPDPFAQTVQLDDSLSIIDYRFAIDDGGSWAASSETEDENPGRMTINLWAVDNGQLGTAPVASRILEIGDLPEHWRWHYNGELAMTGGRAMFFVRGTSATGPGAWVVDLYDDDATFRPVIVPEKKATIRSVSSNLKRLLLGHEKRGQDGVNRAEIREIDPSPGKSLLTVEGTAYGDLSADGRWFSTYDRLFDLDGDYSRPRADKENSDAWTKDFVIGGGKPPLFIGGDKKLWGLDNTPGADSPPQKLNDEFNFTEVAWDDSLTWLALGDEEGRAWILDGRAIVDFATLKVALGAVTAESSLPEPWDVAARDEIRRFVFAARAGWALAITDENVNLLWRGTPDSGWAEPLVLSQRELFTYSHQLECRPDGEQCFIGGQFLTFDEAQMLSMSRPLLSGRPPPQ